jgi:DNA repair protein RecO (recombination protein O)
MTDQPSLAIVLNVTSYGEADKIVTLYSREFGKITSIAKGAKRSRQRFVNKLEPFTCLEISCRPPKNGSLYFLSEAELVNAHLSLRTIYPRYVAATFINELVQRFSGDQDPDPAVFTLLAWAFDSLEQNEDPSKITSLFLLRLLGICGYQPQLDHCGSCRKSIEQGAQFTLYPGNGTLLCESCRRNMEDSSFRLTRQTLKFLHSGQQLQLRRLNRLQMSKEMAYQALAVLFNYSRHILQQDIHSWKQLKKITAPLAR